MNLPSVGEYAHVVPNEAAKASDRLPPLQEPVQGEVHAEPPSEDAEDQS